MLKGEVSIELTNQNTGEKRVIEGHNMVTNALNKMVSILSAVSLSANTSAPKIDVPALSLLGGLILYGDTLTENADNIEAKWDAPIVGKAGQYVSADILRGSYNPNESGKTSTGYKHVWDFTTAQCNGAIKALSLTHAYGADDSAHGYSAGTESTQGQWGHPLWYDEANGELYTYVRTNLSPNYRVDIYKLKLRNIPVKVGDQFLKTDDVMDSTTLISTLTTTYEPINACYDAMTNKAYIITSHATEIIVFDCSTKIAIWQAIGTLPVQKDNADFFAYQSVYNGSLYYVAFSDKHIVRVNINDMTDYHEFNDVVVQRTNTDVLTTVDGINVRTTYNYYMLYPNDTYKLVVGLDGSGQQLSSFFRYYYYNSYCNFGLSFKQRMTIYNLDTPVTKTAADTMKIIYTLTDA